MIQRGRIEEDINPASPGTAGQAYTQPGAEAPGDAGEVRAVRGIAEAGKAEADGQKEIVGTKKERSAPALLARLYLGEAGSA